MNLVNQLCVITGGAKGIGLATARALLARGARVASLAVTMICCSPRPGAGRSRSDL